MKLISDILNDLVNDQISLTVALNKTKVLATRIGNKRLLDWVNSELKGYANLNSVPEYRITHGTIIGDFNNGRQMVTNYPIPLPDLGEKMDDQIRQFRTVDSIYTLESFFKMPGREKLDSLVFPFSDGMRATLEDILRNSNGPYFQLISVGIKVPFHFATSVIAKVKDMLLEFMLEIEKEFGIESDIADLKNNNLKINYIMNNTITNNGDGNVVNTGSNSQITANINIIKGDKEALTKSLKENGVATEDISDLLMVIDTEKPNGNSFGEKVNNWMKKMLAKSIDGTWQVGIGAAGSLLAELIKAYYVG
ncbi:hypothetical protein H9N25_00760 [Pedobacter riviphilus]|uniref:AbiTii domain-containing protein n=1 Tax=Pedobacter riviphilus TaxID=2766984 RepID=A0ABX6TKI0_9SPHI|nr:hypothetical protein [Pedobacter riviphilus]QNR85074.1 hypothetical protein H9N25_00760 [Pedobacter riviphilus]